jgi:hypothetical protein
LFRAISSAGSEHLVYTEGVGGSNPSSPTKNSIRNNGVFLCLIVLWNTLLTFYLAELKIDGICVKEQV